MKIEETIFETRCQKCSAPIIKTPMSELKGPVKGTLLVPHLLYCSECGAVMTSLLRKIRDDEKKKQE